MRSLILLCVVTFIVLAMAGQWYLVRRQKRRVAQMKTEDPDSIYVFTAPSCGICGRMKVAYKEWIDAGAVTLVDVTKQTEVAKRYQVMSVPATFVVRNNTVEKAYFGFVHPKVLAPWSATTRSTSL